MIGEVREKEYLTRIQYGNADPSGGVDAGSCLTAPSGFQPWNRWISCENCIETSFRSVEHQRLVKDIDRRGRARLDPEGKDRMAGVSNRRSAGGSAGVETPTGAVIFALNIDLPGGMKDAPKREAIVRSILQSIGALPALKHARFFMVHLTFVNRSPPLRNWMRSSRS